MVGGFDMNYSKYFIFYLFIFSFLFICFSDVYAGQRSFVVRTDTDTASSRLYSSFDLRNRETFLQITHTDFPITGLPIIIHVQIFDVSNNCNENNFFDNYTINDTHIYNMRDIQTNDGNPSGVVLPADSYGIVVITQVTGFNSLMGNVRILDDSGYEYRTNIQGRIGLRFTSSPQPPYTFNYNSKSNVSLSDIIGITVQQSGSSEYEAANYTDNQYKLFDIDIVNNNEVIFSCRRVIFACIDADNPRQEELLEFAADSDGGGASIARFEYGINDAIPHSRGGEVLCPGNNIPEGAVILNNIVQNVTSLGNTPLEFFGYVGLNNGNGRGSLDSFWIYNFEIPLPQG